MCLLRHLALRASEQASERECVGARKRRGMKKTGPVVGRNVPQNRNREKTARWRANDTSAASLFFHTSVRFMSTRSPWCERRVERHSLEQPTRPIKEGSITGRRRRSSFCLFL